MSRANAAALLDAIKPKTVAAGLRLDAKPDPKELGDEPNALGMAIAKALVLADLTKQDVSFRMGYTDASSISKWISGKEPPRFDKLWSVIELREPLVIALGKRAGFRVRITLSARRVA